MSLGVLGARPVMGLGADVSPPQWWCWKAAGYAWGAAFDACHAKNYQKCSAAGRWPGTKDGDQCVYTLDLACGCPTSPPSAPSTTTPSASPTATPLVMGNKTSDPRVVQLQQAINAVLTKNGYAAIGTDGKLGPGTCGAAREADKFGAGLMAQYGLASVCTSFTPPPRSGGAPSFGPTGPVGPPPDTLSAGTMLGMDTKTLLLVGVIALGAVTFFGKKKKKPA